MPMNQSTRMYQMNLPLTVNVSVSEQSTVIVGVAEEEQISVRVEEGVKVSGGGDGGTPDYYAGSYKVYPRTSQQTLRTRSKTMKDNVTVFEIPRHEVSNSSGTTLIIGGI